MELRIFTSATFRLPGPLAITVAGVDQMSGGRVELGLGAGWFTAEHEAYGIPFPGLGERFDRLEEQLEIVTGLWASEGGFEFAGDHFQLRNSPGLPKPVQRSGHRGGHRGGAPVIVGQGKRRTPYLAATYADEFNAAFVSVDATAARYNRVREASAVAGLAAETMTYSAAQVVCVGRDEAEVDRRAAAIGREKAELRENGLAGTPAEVIEKIGAFAQVGASRLYLQVLDLGDLEHLELIAAEILPQV